MGCQLPSTDIIIEDCTVFTDPYEDADNQLKQEREEELERQKKEEEAKTKKSKKKTSSDLKVYKQGIGKYINANALKKAAVPSAEDSEGPEPKKKSKISGGFGNFSSW